MFYDGMSTAAFLDAQAKLSKSKPSLRFFVQGDPVPKGRPRLSHGAVYTPKRTQAWETLVAWEARAAMQAAGMDIFTEPVSIALQFYYGNRGADLDNLVKAVWDAFNGVVWCDDVQVVELIARIQRGVPKAQRGVRIEVMV